MIAITNEVPKKKKATQKDRIKAHLLSGKSITPVECFERGWGMRLAAIIHTLRSEGMNIETKSETSRFGHKYAKYELVSVMFQEKLNKLRLLLGIYNYTRAKIEKNEHGDWILNIPRHQQLEEEHYIRLQDNTGLRLIQNRWEDSCTGYCYNYTIQKGKEYEIQTV